jgi:hypothetical protein
LRSEIQFDLDKNPAFSNTAANQQFHALVANQLTVKQTYTTDLYNEKKTKVKYL